ncbi:hypothetical protein AKJ54_01155, partial [candidate division MSBL1 archaeon SCGC-AAA382K21]
TAHSSDFLDSIDEATRSTFMHNIVELDKYNAEQISDILSQRIEIAFKPDMVRVDTIDLISDIASRSGDARFALELLWLSGRIASQGEVEKVSPNHARRAKAEIHPEIRKDVLADLGKHELFSLLAISRRLKISDSSYVLTGDVEEAYKVVCEEYDEKPRVHTQFWRYLRRMDNLGLIDTEPSRGGHRGQSQKIRISDAPPEMMEGEIQKIIDRVMK